MPKAIIQKIVFKNTASKALYNIYMDAKKHSASIGAPVSIQKKEGTKYTAHGSYITGKNLQLVKDKMIVQSWRSSDFKKADLDSILILLFEEKSKDAILTMVHANLPDHQYQQIKDGWNEFYWKPWKIYLAGKKEK